MLPSNAMYTLKRSSVRAVALVACLLLPPALVASCKGNGGSLASSTGAGGAGGSNSSGTFFVGAGGSTVDGCAGPDADDGGDGSTGCEGIEGGVLYDAQVTSILANNCGGEFCHSVPTHDSLVDMVASECCDGRFLVQPGNAAQSYLLDKLEGHDICEGARMPFNGTPLSDADILTLTQWICEGAPAN